MPQKKKTSKKSTPPSPSHPRIRDSLAKRPASGRPSSSTHPSSALILRPARAADQPAIEEMARHLFPRATPAFSPDDHYFVAHYGEHLAGWVHLHARAHSIVLQGLAVHPSFRRRGIGQALLRLALRQAQLRQPHQQVALKVKASNAPALSLYVQEGFMLVKDEGGTYLLTRAAPN